MALGRVADLRLLEDLGGERHDYEYQDYRNGEQYKPDMVIPPISRVIAASTSIPSAIAIIATPRAISAGLGLTYPAAAATRNTMTARISPDRTFV